MIQTLLSFVFKRFYSSPISITLLLALSGSTLCQIRSQDSKSTKTILSNLFFASYPQWRDHMSSFGASLLSLPKSKYLSKHMIRFICLNHSLQVNILPFVTLPRQVPGGHALGLQQMNTCQCRHENLGSGGSILDSDWFLNYRDK